MIRWLDTWLGKNLFIPPIIRFVQATGVSQYKVHTYIWLATFFWGVYVGPGDNPNWVDWTFYVLVCLLALVWTVLTARDPEHSKRTVDWIRWLFVILFVIDLVFLAIAIIVGKDWPRAAWDLFRHTSILVAEYALTIKTIPPLEAEEWERKLRLARLKK